MKRLSGEPCCAYQTVILIIDDLASLSKSIHAVDCSCSFTLVLFSDGVATALPHEECVLAFSIGVCERLRLDICC